MRRFVNFKALKSIILLLIFILLSGKIFGMMESDKVKNPNVVSIKRAPMVKSAGAEEYVAPAKGSVQSLGFDQSASLSPGRKVGSTTYDYQSNGRMNRQVDWRGNQWIHFTWTKQIARVPGEGRRTSYEAWDPVQGLFAQEGQADSGGCDIHDLTNNISGYTGIDVTPEGKVVIGNHHSRTGEASDYASTVWYDFGVGSCFFSPYRSRLPDSAMHYFPAGNGVNYMIWPNIEYQVYGTDTVTHLLAQQGNVTSPPSILGYFRRVGSAENGVWDYPPVTVDTVNDIAYVVTTSRVSRKVAMVWLAPYPYDLPGGSESGIRNGDQRVNDVWYRKSNNMGAPGSWVPSTGGTNVTKFDSSKSGWLAHADLSALIDTQDKLHIIWDAREYSPSGGGTWPHFYGSMLFHWDDGTDEVRVIKNANWDLPEQGCNGGTWNEMSIVKMQISECDGKFYALFVQFNDIYNGIGDDCQFTAFTQANKSGTANGELYISVSDNGGYNWDIARNLTNSYTPRCDTAGNTGGHIECDADQWPSMSRFGIDTLGSGADFSGVPVIDPSGTYAGAKFLDIFYVNDKYPGGCVRDAGIWTMNPMKWFWVPCIEPVRGSAFAWSPYAIEDPAWTLPNVQLDTIVRLFNIGNTDMNISSVTAVKLTGTSVDWLNLGTTPTSISYLTPNYFDMHVLLGGPGVMGTTGYSGLLIFAGDFASSPDTMQVHIIIADTVQPPGWARIRTTSKSVWFNNAGNLGRGGTLNYGWNGMAFFNDCDTANNITGANDNARTYLYDASPFVLRAKLSTDTLYNNYIWNSDWLSENGFRPLEGGILDSTSYPGYQYGYTGRFITHDSAIGVECEYFAPTDPDSSDFIVQRTKFYNRTASTLIDVFLGEVMDWDIPSDSGVENGSGFDASRKMMYVYGAEYGADTGRYSTWNDCVLANQRYGGFSYCVGFRTNSTFWTDSIGHPKCMFTGTNGNWQRMLGNFPPQALYNKLAGLTGYEAWQSTVPSMQDSLYQDLNMVACYGNFYISTRDTLVFIKIFSTVYNSGLAGLQASIDKAKIWLVNHNIFYLDRMCCTCCWNPGDANNDHVVNILDVSYLINYLYKQGPEPACPDDGDVNASGNINILDVAYFINALYKSGPSMQCGCITCSCNNAKVPRAPCSAPTD
ncbi:hypothetical protein TRIP_C21524 [Candidatus Zixiibacteriota bacterium]|nr:hypothetical protein TRIP_C21524 [candidate division Zixibacteria bacterium]